MDKAVRPDQLREDGIHPNDEGYHNMALQWLQGVDEAEELGWIEPPQPNDNSTLMIVLLVVFGIVMIFAVGVPVYMCCFRGSALGCML
jgi:hypothetical protein